MQIMSHKQSPALCLTVRHFKNDCKTEHKSLNFLPTSTLWITFIFQGNAPQNLPKYMYHSFVNVMAL